MSRILIPRSDSVSAKVIEPSDFEEMNSHVQDHIKSGFTVTAGSGLAVNVAAGKISLKGLYVNNTSTEAVTVTASNTNHIYVVLARDSNSEAESWSFVANTTGSAPADSIKIATCVASGSAVTSVDQTFTSAVAGQYYLVPKGGIIMWSGTIANIPTGWVLCDGSNGTPNLIAKFIRGVATNSTNPGTTGGSDTHTLTTAEMPAHTHTDSGHTHANSSWSYQNSGDPSSNAKHLPTTGSSGGSTSTQGVSVGTGTANIQSTGGGQAHENRPAFYEIAYIMRT